MNVRATALAALVSVGATSCGSDTAAPGGATAGTSGANAGGLGGTSDGAGGAATAAGNGGAVAGGGAHAGSAGSAGHGGSENGGNAAAGGGGENGGSAAAGSGGSGGSSPSLPKRVLLYHFSTLDIPSVSTQLSILSDLLMDWGYEVKSSVSASELSSASLAQYGGVGMINTCFEPFGAGKMGEAETAALKSFVEAGGGLFGTHCASVTFQSAQPPHPYNALIGGRGGDGYFNGSSACTVVQQHTTTAMLPATFEYVGDLDNADYLAPDSTVLVKCKWSGGEQKETAVSWYRTPGQGRVFYTNFAKEDEDLSDANLGAKHILLGLGWVLRR